MLSDLTFQQTTDPTQFDDIAALRADIWQCEGFTIQSLNKKGQWFDELDAVAIHWVIFYQQKLIAAARLSLHLHVKEIPYAYLFSNHDLPLTSPFALLSRLVVSKPMRRRGIAKNLDQLRIQEAQKHRANHSIVLAAPHRVNALKKLGFIGVGKPQLPALRTVHAVLPHTALQSIVSSSGLA
ncbi:MAG: GNAT family N-acetyltransferase [Mariprofundaceae bacterium]|nr:GNAT family N-acetyltransferase [Mariprofundaceae bacterium]